MYFLTALIITASVFDASSSIHYPSPAPSELSPNPALLILAREYDNGENEAKPEITNLQLPAPIGENRANRRCMTVCSEWGEECVMENAGSDFVTSKCMRTCTSFAEECL